MRQHILSSTFIRLRDRLHSVAAGIVGNADDADDVIHEAFCRLWSRHSDIIDEVAAVKLTYTAVRNQAIDSFRHSRSHPSVGVDSLQNGDVVDSREDEVEDADSVYAAVMEMSRKVLKEKQYEVFRLHDVEGMPYPEVASELGMTQENVRMTLSRARKTIREIYRKQKNSL